MTYVDNSGCGRTMDAIGGLVARAGLAPIEDWKTMWRVLWFALRFGKPAAITVGMELVALAVYLVWPAACAYGGIM